MSPRQPLNRARIADLVVGAAVGGILAAAFWTKFGWPAFLFVPLGLLWQRYSRLSFEKWDRETENEITISLDLDPKPDGTDRRGGAA